MSGWTTGGRHELRYFDFSALLRDGMPLCQVAELPAGVVPLAQALEAPGSNAYALLWSDGFVALDEDELPGLLEVSPAWLAVLQAVVSPSGEGPATWDQRAVLARALARTDPFAELDWTPADPVAGHATWAAPLGGERLLRVQGPRRTAVVLASSGWTAGALDAWVSDLRVSLEEEGDPVQVVLGLPPGTTLETLQWQLGALQQLAFEEFTLDWSFDLGPQDYAALLSRAFGYRIEPADTPVHAGIELIRQWEQMSRFMTRAQVQAHRPPRARRALWQRAPIGLGRWTRWPWAERQRYVQHRLWALTRHPELEDQDVVPVRPGRV